jgi:hypothetical protein
MAGKSDYFYSTFSICECRIEVMDTDRLLISIACLPT